MRSPLPEQRRNALTPELKRERFGPGPWVTEPDTVEFEAHGLHCRVLRHPEMGFLCGYVAVPRRHPLHGLHYDDVLLSDVYVHGGMTFAGYYSKLSGLEDPEPQPWLFGFDCAHYLDVSPGLDAMTRKSGFYTAKLDMLRGQLSDAWRPVYRSVEYVYAQCVELAAQLTAAGARDYSSHTFCRGCKEQKGLRLVDLRQGDTWLCGRCWAVLRQERSGRHMREMGVWARAQTAKRERTLRLVKN